MEKKWEMSANIFEYESVANPPMAPIPVLVHPPTLHESGPTRVIGFEIGDKLEISGSCTTPNLMASFVRISVGETIDTEANATSQAFYVIRGQGSTSSEYGEISWDTGDLFVVPITNGALIHKCVGAEDFGGAALYWVHDGPLMDYLGVTPTTAKFYPALFKRERMLAEVQNIDSGAAAGADGAAGAAGADGAAGAAGADGADGAAGAGAAGVGERNRLGVLLGNEACGQTKTLTHVLWSLLNSIPANSVQRAHRHNSVALDLAVVADENVYTLMGKEVDNNGDIIDPIRCDWISGGVFVTPPGWWHSHHNESNKIAWVLPIQDAGLFTHQRTLDIRFVDDEIELHRGGKIRGSAFTLTDKQYTDIKNNI